MNSSLMLHDPAEAGLHCPNYVFVADQHQQRIVCSNMASPQSLLTQTSHDTDLYQAHLHSPSSPVLQLRNIREDLIDALVSYWKDKNTVAITDSMTQASSLTDGIFRFFETCIDAGLFDPRLDLALREWARRSTRIHALVDSDLTLSHEGHEKA